MVQLQAPQTLGLDLLTCGAGLEHATPQFSAEVTPDIRPIALASAGGV